MNSEHLNLDDSCRRVDHIAIAVRDIESALPLYKLLGFALQDIDEVESEQVRVAKLHAENVTIELLEPLTEASTVHKFLETNGPGLHHICLEADDLDETLTQLEQNGFEPVYDAPKQGAEKRNINFLHPDDTCGVLIELQQATDTNSSNP